MLCYVSPGYARPKNRLKTKSIVLLFGPGSSLLLPRPAAHVLKPALLKDACSDQNDVYIADSINQGVGVSIIYIDLILAFLLSSQRQYSIQSHILILKRQKWPMENRYSEQNG